MNKSSLVSYIEKYHLGGMINSVVWSIKNKVVQIKFVSMLNSTAGVLYFPFEMKDASFGVYDTNSLLKLLSIMKDDIEISLQEDKGVIIKMNIIDSVYESSFSLASINSIELPPDIEEPKVYEVSFSIDKDFKDRYLKAYRALGSINRFTIEAGKTIKITLGDTMDYANKISFTMKSDDYLPLKSTSFSGDAIAEILRSNDDITSGTLEVSEEGLLKIYLKDENYSVSYFIVKLEDL